MLLKSVIHLSVMIGLISILFHAKAQEPKIVVPTGHTEEILKGLFSPNDKLFVTSSSDGVTKLWDLSTGRLLNTFEGTSPYFTQDGNLLITTASWEFTRVWEVKTGKLLHTFDGYSSVLSPDQKNLATIVNQKLDIKQPANIGLPFVCKYWNLATGENEFSFRISQLTDGTPYIYFSPDSIHMVTVVDHEGIEAELKVWDLSTGKKVYEEDGVYFRQFGPQGQLIIYTSYLYSKQEPWRIKVLEIGPNGVDTRMDGPVLAKYSPNGKYLATSDGTSISIVDGSSYEQIFQMSTDEKLTSSNILQMFFSPDSRKLLVGRDNYAELWRMNNFQKPDTIYSPLINIEEDNQFTLTYNFSPDSKNIVIASGLNRPELWGLDSLYRIGSYEMIAERNPRVLMGPNGKTVYISRQRNYSANSANISDQRWNIWSTSHTEPVHSFDNEVLAFSTSGEMVAAKTASEPDISKSFSRELVHIKNLNNSNKLSLTGISNNFKAAVFSNNGGFFSATLSPNKSADNFSLIEMSSGRIVYTSDTPIRFHPEDQLFARLETQAFEGDKQLELRRCDNGDTLKIVTYPKAEDWRINDWGFTPAGDLEIWDSPLVYSPDGNLIASLSPSPIADPRIDLWQVGNNQKPLHSFFPDLQSLASHQVIFSNNSRSMAIYSSLDPKVYLVNTKSGKAKLIENEDNSWVDRVSFNSDNRLVAINYFRSTQIIDFVKGSFIKQLPGVSQSIFSPDGKRIFANEPEGLIVYHLDTWNKEKNLGCAGYELRDIHFETSKGIVTRGPELVVFDIHTGEQYLNFIMLDSFNWVVIHSSGLFDATPEAMDKLYFVSGLETIELNQLKARYFEPGLWRKVMIGEKLRSVMGFKEVELPPDVKLGQVDHQGNIEIEVTDRGGGIGEVSLYVNGKETIRDLRQTVKAIGNDGFVVAVPVSAFKNLVPGEVNYLAVKAWNSGQWIESKGEVIEYRPPAKHEIKPAIHILTCGISDYTGDAIDLKYAAKDAEDVAYALELGSGRLFGTEKSNLYRLTTGNTSLTPTKKNILQTLEKISDTATSQDVVVVYLSGHGINIGGADGDFYYLTQEAYTANTHDYNDPAIRDQCTLSSSELVEHFKKIPALKQVLIIDACSSGKVVDNLMVQRNIESGTLRALDRLKDRTGMHIITGCTADAVSYEASRYGQGVLTYSLLEGLRGIALRENKFADVVQLFQYAQERVPILASGIGGIQKPQVFSPRGSQSFDIAELTSEDKMRIPLAVAKPVYIRSNFIDSQKFKDALGLGYKVDQLLNYLSSKGMESPILFVDVSEYPEGCQLSGLYSQENVSLNLKMNLTCGTKESQVTLTADNDESLIEKILQFVTSN